MDLSPLQSYRVRSGNYEHPSDLLYNTTVEVQPGDFSRAKKKFAFTPDEFVIIGKPFKRKACDVVIVIFHRFLVGQFNDLGIAEGKIDNSLNPIAAIRLVIKSASKNWVIISEVK